MREISVMEVFLKKALFDRVLKSKGVDPESLEKEVDDEYKRIISGIGFVNSNESELENG
jgi:hypothetical protein